jgi:hypothetical protein
VDHFTSYRIDDVRAIAGTLAQKISDAELLRLGKAAKYMCPPQVKQGKLTSEGSEITK